MIFIFFFIMLNTISGVYLLEKQHHLGRKYGFDPMQYKRKDFLFCEETEEFARWNDDFEKEFRVLKNRMFIQIGVIALMPIPMLLSFYFLYY